MAHIKKKKKNLKVWDVCELIGCQELFKLVPP